jgi:hypothetical protein
VSRAAKGRRCKRLASSFGGSSPPTPTIIEEEVMKVTELENVELKIRRLKEIMNTKAHGKTSDDLKLLQQLSELYKQRTRLRGIV